MPSSHSPFSQPLAHLTQWTLRYPAAVLWVAVILALVAIGITANGLEFKNSRLDLLNPESRYNKRWLAYLDEFGDRDDAVIVVRSADPGAVRDAIDDVARTVGQHPQLYESVLWRRDLSRIKAKGLHLAPIEALQQLAAQLRPLVAAVESGAGADPADALARLNREMEQASRLTPDQLRLLEQQYAQVARMLSAPAVEGVRHAALQNVAPSPAAAGTAAWMDRLTELDPQYLTAEEGRMGFVLLRLAVIEDDFARGGKAIGQLREIIDQVGSRHSGVWLGLTGMPVIEYDEMRISQWDMLWTNVVSLVGCVLLFVAGYGGIRHAGMATAVLLIGMAWSFAFVTLAVGHLNILSSAFAIVLIGLGIDFGIHYVASYLKLCQSGIDPQTALIRTAHEVGPGVVTSGVTTAAAFFMAGLTQFVGVRELGIIAGGGILLCVVSAVVVLPPLILVCDRERQFARSSPLLPIAGWFHWLHAQPRLVLSLAVLGTVVSAAGVIHLRYDHNLLNLQPVHVESVEIEREIFANQEDSVWFAVSLCDSRHELRQRKALFDKLPSVAKTEEIASLIPDPDPRRQELVAEVHAALTSLFESSLAKELQEAGPVPRGQREDGNRLQAELGRGAALLQEALPYESPLATQLARSARQAADLSPQHAAALAAGAQQARQSLRQTITGLAPLLAVSDPSPPTTGDLPRELADRYIGRTSKHLLKVYARGDVWDMDRLERFVADVESIDPLATGHPVQTYYASRHMQSSYIQAGALALLAVFALLLFDFRSIRYSLLAMVPLALGFVQMCGLIGWIGIPLNAANLIALPLILGIGVDDGVHLVHEMRRSRRRFKLTDATAVAVILISTTTMASFGALVLARHQGLRSLGQVLTLGTFLCLTCSMLAFPALLTWLTRHRSEGPEDAEDWEDVPDRPFGQDVPVEEAEQPECGQKTADLADALVPPCGEQENEHKMLAAVAVEIANNREPIAPADAAESPIWISAESLEHDEVAAERAPSEPIIEDPLMRSRGITPRRRAG